MGRFFAGAVLFLAITSLTAEEQPQWVKATPQGGNCEILYPTPPKTVSQKDGVQVTLEREVGKAALMLQYNMLPAVIDIGNSDQVKLFFDGARGGMLKALKGAKLLSEKDGLVNKYPARDVALAFPSIGYYRVRLILTGPRLYQIVVLGSNDYVNGGEAKKFMTSFKFTK